MRYVIGTRGSRLALAQAREVRDTLSRAYQDDAFEIQAIQTRGDLARDVPLHEIGARGVFVREIEEKLLSGEIHIGVHSMKDMPAFPAQGLVFARAWRREDPRDALILREKASLWELPKGAVIGTGSKRRELQLKKLRPDLQVRGIRGNVETRLRKMSEEGLDGIVLAAAGLHRLGLGHLAAQYFEPEDMVPAPAQGVLALEVREGEGRLLEMLSALCDRETERAVEAERGFLRQMGAGCQNPVGALLRRGEGGGFRLDVMFGREDGTKAAYASVCGEDGKELARKAAAKMRQALAGTVFLVGAGPGDPELITVKGLRALREAGCVIYDRLIPEGLLQEAKPGCELIYVGKASRSHTKSQEEINRLLLKKSMEHQTIVRLKGGDPYVFGRGGEEGSFLIGHGVPFEVIPGVSSCIAGPAYAGIPVTHRGLAQGFHAVTAHSEADALADLDFEAMARGKETCVFLMGLSKLGEIAKRLAAAGMPRDTEIAVISKASTPEQTACVSDLGHIAEAASRARLSSPALIVAGPVVSLRKKLNFFEGKPLFGKRYLIPKIGKEATRLRGLLLRQGASVTEAQVGEIVETPGQIDVEAACGMDWLIFTSKNGVRVFFKAVKESGRDARGLAGCRVAAIGEKTKEALFAYGICADLIPREHHSGALGEALKRRLTGGEKALYVKAKDAGRQLRDALAGHCAFYEASAYENRATDFPFGEVGPYEAYDGALFTCASSAERLICRMGADLGTCRAYSIGPKTTDCLRSCGVRQIFEARERTYEGLAECVAER